MANQETDISIYCDTDTLIKAYVLMIINAMVAMGWIQETSCTGQFSTSTGVRATAVNTELGYLMFRMNDALQATRPIFLRIGIRSIQQNNAISGGQPYYCVALSFQVGFSVNSAGALTSDLTSTVRVISFNPSASPSPATNTLAVVQATSKHLFSGANNRLAFARGVDSPNTEGYTVGVGISATNAHIRHGFFSVERTKDADGEDTTDGFIIVTSGGIYETLNTQLYFQQVVLWGKPQSNVQGWWHCPMIANTISTRQYDEYILIPIFPTYGTKLLNAGINQGGFISGEFSYSGTPGVPFNAYETQRYYRPITADLFRPILGLGGNSFLNVGSSRLAMLWE